MIIQIEPSTLNLFQRRRIKNSENGIGEIAFECQINIEFSFQHEGLEFCTIVSEKKTICRNFLVP
jgi:hypothetical protein